MTSSEISTKTPKFLASQIAENGDKNTIADTSEDTGTVNISKGFPSAFSTPRSTGGKSVARRDMNGLLNSMSSLNYYFQYMGRNPYVSGKSYPQGAKVWYNDAEYVSTVDSNVTVPGATGASWIKLNDLSGTSGGTTVDCSWKNRADDIETLLTNAGKIPGIETDIDTLQTQITEMQENITSMQSSLSSIESKMSTGIQDVWYDPDNFDYTTQSFAVSSTATIITITGTFTWFRIVSFSVSGITTGDPMPIALSDGESYGKTILIPYGLVSGWLKCPSDRSMKIIGTSSTGSVTGGNITYMYPKS